MVSEATFVQGAGGTKFMGGADLMGRFPGAGGLRGPGASLSNSFELTLQKGLCRLNVIADRMQLNMGIQEAARRMYQLAAQMSFTSGRPLKLVAVACLYVVCRRNRSPHLMVDFSDEIRVPVVNIGRTYLRLLRRLVGGDQRDPQNMLVDPTAAEVPIIDPSLFVERFARQLDCGHSQRAVQQTAVKLIQFMHRDWICVGRRPNGLCGAALLIASYYHGFRHSAGDIAGVVRLGEDTIRKRLFELQSTPLASMSRKDFLKADPKVLPLQDSMPKAMPPCWLKSRGFLEGSGGLSPAVLMDSPTSPWALAGLPIGANPATPSPAGVLADAERTPKRMRGDSGEASALVGPVPTQGKADQDRLERFTARVPSVSDIERSAQDIADHLRIGGIMPSAPPLQDAPPTTDPSSPGFLTAQGRIEDIVEGRKEFATPPAVGDGRPLAEGASQSASLPVVDGSSKPSTPAAGGKQAEPLADNRAMNLGSDEEEGLSDLDEDELESYLLDEAERQDKAAVWLEINRDYLEEWHVRSKELSRKRKEKAAAAGEAAGSETASVVGSQTGSQRSGGSRRWRPRAGSCVESTALALHKKGKVHPSRINMEALQSLFDD